MRSYRKIAALGILAAATLVGGAVTPSLASVTGVVRFAGGPGFFIHPHAPICPFCRPHHPPLPPFATNFGGGFGGGGHGAYPNRPQPK